MATYHAIDPATYLHPMAAPSVTGFNDGIDSFDDLGFDAGDDEPNDDDDEPDGDGCGSQYHFTPSFAIPGSEEKIVILAARYEAGVPLWHDDDLTAFAGDIYAVMD